MARPSWARTASSLPSASPTTRAIAGQSSCGFDAAGRTSSTTPGKARSAARLAPSSGAFSVAFKAAELVAIAAQGHRFSRIVLGLPGPIDPDAHLNRPAPDLLADQPLEVRLERRVGLADPG